MVFGEWRPMALLSAERMELRRGWQGLRLRFTGCGACRGGINPLVKLPQVAQRRQALQVLPRHWRDSSGVTGSPPRAQAPSAAPLQSRGPRCHGESAPGVGLARGAGALVRWVAWLHRTAVRPAARGKPVGLPLENVVKGGAL